MPAGQQPFGAPQGTMPPAPQPYGAPQGTMPSAPQPYGAPQGTGMPYGQQPYGAPQGAVFNALLASFGKHGLITVATMAAGVLILLGIFFLCVVNDTIKSAQVLGMLVLFWYMPAIIAGTALEFLPEQKLRIAGRIVAASGLVLGAFAIIKLFSMGYISVAWREMLSVLFGVAAFVLVHLKNRMAQQG